MNKITYGVIVFILVLIILLYYMLQKPHEYNLEDVYARHMLTVSNPDNAFTHKKLKDGTYENYYRNYDLDDTSILKKVIADKPVTSDGNSYEPVEHGTITETENGFRISGVAADFKCPKNWFWDKDIHSCRVDTLCTNADVGKLKGIDYYHFQMGMNHTQNSLNNRNIKYQDRLYAKCHEGGVFEVLACPDNMLYNQLEVQDDTLPCELYDVCSDMMENQIHKVQINEDVLNDKQYYICKSGKSKLKECSGDTVFSVSANGCINTNICIGKDDNFTIYADSEEFYIMCKNENDYKIYCKNGLYKEDGLDNLSCNIDVSKKYFKYYSNDYISIPIGIYIYKNNKREERFAKESIIERSIPLEPSTSDFTTIPRNKTLYGSVLFQQYFIDYTDPIIKDDTIDIKLDNTNYEDFKPRTTVSASYYTGVVPPIDWNIFNDIPENPKTYYKYDKVIKHKTDETYNKPSIDYFFFNTSNIIYKPKDPYYVEVDEPAGILYHATFRIATNHKSGIDTRYNITYSPIRMVQMPDGIYIMYFVNASDNMVVAMALDPFVVDSGSFKILDDHTCKPTFYNYKPIEIYDYTQSYTRMTSIKWNGSIQNSDYYILPEFLLMLNFDLVEEFNKYFTILKTVNIFAYEDLDKFSKRVEDSYIPITEHTGDVTYIKQILKYLYKKYVSRE